MLRTEMLRDLAPERRAQILTRGEPRRAALTPAVDTIITRVRASGDAALLDYTRQFDGVLPATLVVPQHEIDAALASADPDYVMALRAAAANIDAFHRAQLRATPEAAIEHVTGVRVWREWRPIERIGVYVPGGRALYPSCLLMCVIPARIAGCTDIAVTTPPGPDGYVPAALLAAAAIAGVTRVYAVGGVQAIAALAYGTESVRKVDKIVGPGNSYVAAAKLRVASDVAIDMPAGPSEILIVADETADPACVAADLLAQAEHGPDSACVLVTTSATLAKRVATSLTAQIASLATAPTIRASLLQNGAILLANDLADAIAFANDYAAEHLAIITSDPRATLAGIQHAGSVFLGNQTPVAAGDYATGGNQTLPTAGFARSFTPLAVETFGRWMQVQSLTADGLAQLATTITTLATVEGLPAHAASIRARTLATYDETSTLSTHGAETRTLSNHAESGILSTHSTESGNAVTPLASDIVTLNANENPYAPTPLVADALRNAVMHINRYPDSNQRVLRDALAHDHGVESDRIIAGNGSDELIHLLTLAAITPGDAIIVCEPTFGVYRHEAVRHGATVVDVPLLDDFALDAAAVLAAITPRTRIVWLCSPNNPTGTAIDLSILPALLERGPLVVVDEAYRAPDGPSALSLAPHAERLIVMGTMSKVAGLAGLRLGYAIAHPTIITRLDAQRLPYNVNTLAATAAIAALQEGDAIAARWQRICAERDTFTALLAALPGAHIHPSVANFVLLEFAEHLGADVASRLAQRGILVRAFDHPRLHHCLRVTVGTPSENQRFVAALSTLLSATPQEVAR